MQTQNFATGGNGPKSNPAPQSDVVDDPGVPATQAPAPAPAPAPSPAPAPAATH
ncbi:MAG: hypothetical protein V4641_16395 [Pseudomonadota bacterium]